jgi:transcriptional regulator with XRE-family HTH domain
MNTRNDIFGLRFVINDDIHPTREELQAFLDGPREDGSGKTRRDWLVRYRDLLAVVEDYEQGQLQGATAQGFHDKMLYGAISHSHLVRPTLNAVVEQYLYHLHVLSTIDFKKPIAFIRSAEEEIRMLSPKRTDEAAKRDRLQGMIDDRKKALDALKKLWQALAAELSNILQYVCQNLVRVDKLCELSGMVLADELSSGTKENELVSDIKEHYKERLKEFRRHGSISQEQLEAAKEEVAVLTERLSKLVREDVQSLTAVYQAIGTHISKLYVDLNGAAKSIERKSHKQYDEDVKLYTQAAGHLLALVSDLRIELKPIDIGGVTEQDEILFEKRRQMLAYLLELLQQTPHP